MKAPDEWSAGPPGLMPKGERLPPAPPDGAEDVPGCHEAQRSTDDRGARPASLKPAAAASRRSASDAAALACALLLALPAAGQGIPEPLTGTPGDPARGREIVADRTRGLCILCHEAPLPEVRFMGNLAPDLAGVGARLTVPELRERIVDSRRVNPDTIMPPYHSLANLTRVGSRWKGTTILSEQEVEDVVAYLATLTEDGDAE